MYPRSRCCVPAEKGNRLRAEEAGLNQGWGPLDEWKEWNRAFLARRRVGVCPGNPKKTRAAAATVCLPTLKSALLASTESRTFRGWWAHHCSTPRASSVPGLWPLCQKQMSWQWLER